MLTECAAWKDMAEFFNGKTDNPLVILGLCRRLKDLPVGPQVRQRMEKKIADGKCGVYLWPLTVDGNKCRVRFCLQQAKKLQRDQPRKDNKR